MRGEATGPLPEIDGFIAAAAQLADEVVHGAGLRLELRRTDAGEAHEVRVAAAERPVAEPRDQRAHAFVLAALASAVQRLDRHHPVERWLRLVVGEEPHRRTPRMTGER